MEEDNYDKKYFFFLKIRQLFFWIIPTLAFLQFMAVFVIVQERNLYLEYFYLICALSISLLLLESVLLRNNVLKYVTSPINKEYKSPISKYLSLTYIASFIVMSILNLVGLEQYTTFFYLLIIINGLSFLILDTIEKNYKKKHNSAKVESIQ